ncbi:MAG: phage tail tape measure protein [Lachnospiraceae bacterium]|nr:phage tail tape measure protein [Lachnospiraceae bacterium]
MASSKELKAIISIAGTIDPSLAKSISQATKQTSGLGTILKTTAAIGGAAFTAASAAVIKFGSDAVQAASGYEQAFANASTLMQGSGEELKGISDDILAVSTEFGIAAEEVANSVYSALSAGIDQADAVQFAGDAAKLAAAGFTDVDTALSATAKTLNAYGLEASETERIQKVLIQTQNLGITTVGELGQSLANVTPTAAMMGVSFEEVGAAMAGLTAQGTPTAQAATKLKSLFSELGKSGTTAAKNLQKATEGTEYAGKSFSELEAAGVDLGTIINLMGDYAEKNGLKMADMFSKSEAGSAAASLAMMDFKTNLEGMSTDADVVGEAYDKVTNTFEHQSEVLKTTFQNFKISAGEELLPFLNDIASTALPAIQEGLGNLLPVISESFNEVGPAIQSAVDELMPVITNFIETVGPALADLMPVITEVVTFVIEELAKIITFLAQVFTGDWKGAWETVKSIFSDIWEAIKAILAPVAEYFEGVGEDLGNFFIDAWDSIETTFETACEAIGTYFTDTWESIKSAFTSVKEFFESAGQAIGDYFVSAWDTISTNWNNGVNAIQETTSSIFSSVQETISTVMDGIVEKSQTAFNSVREAIMNSALGPFIEEICTYIQEQFQNIISFVTDVFSGNWQAAWADIQAYFQTAWDGMLGIMQAAIEALMSIGQSIISFFSTMWNNVVQAWSNGIASLDALTGGALSAAVQNVLAVFEQLKQNIVIAFENIKTAIINSQLGQTVQEIITEVQEIFNSILTFLNDTFIGTWTQIWETVKNVFTTAFSSLAGVIKTAFNAVISLINKVIEAINSIHLDVPKFAQGILGTASWGPHIDPLPMLASGGFTNGMSIAGEAGQEAVISFDQSVRRQNLSYWAKAGKLLGVNATAVDTLAANASSGNKTGGNSIVFSPNVTIQGNADYDMVMQALRDNEAEFMDILDEFYRNKGQVAYG